MDTKLSALLQNRVTIPSIVGVVALAGGIGLGYILGKRNGYTYVIQASDLKENKPVEDPNQMYLPLEDKTPEELHNEVIRDLAIADGHPSVPFQYNEVKLQMETFPDLDAEIHAAYEEAIPNVVNIFAKNTDSLWDYEAELSTRAFNVPYVLHKDEFFGEEMDFRQETLTYYAGDDIMADNADKPIYDHNGLMGELKFGHGSGDPNVVYIRNEKIHMEWEILYHRGSFEHEVLGLRMEQEDEHELKHSVQKFRRE